MANTYFDSVDPKPDFPKLEKDLQDEWYKEGVVDKYLYKNKNSSKYFSFLDGPITANNPMGIHHAWGRTYKDLWQRYKNMQGYRQRFQNGFDCQGLWVEVEVEKELGFKSKKDIEKFGIAEFVQKCRDRVNKYSAIQTEQSKRLGYFMDWDNSYYTMSDENNYAIWKFLKKCHEMNLIYKGHDVVPWCPRCETAISEHEILTEDYKQVIHDSVYFKMQLKNKEGEYLLVWTTTPWTLPANISVAVDESFDYSLVEMENGDKLWIAEKLREKVLGSKAKIIKIVKGKDLLGLEYKAPFDDLPVVFRALKENISNEFHKVIATDSFIMPITTEEGTGLVHTSTGTGSEDFKLGKKLGLPVIQAIDNKAYYLSGFGFLEGKNAKKHPELIFDYLKTYDGGKFLFKVEPYSHRYPSCWRCKTELVWKVTDEWYISMDFPSKLKVKSEKLKVRTLREKMIEVTKKIKWLPYFGLERELDWLKNMHDWMISKKNRYWGLALPIWECPKCNSFEVIGSKEELNERSVSGNLEGSPHKPQIDQIKIKCSKCGEVLERIEPVGNPWLDAGIVAFSTLPKGWFPADFITESFPGQFKNWFYSLIAMATVMENKEPFRTVLGFATLFDEKGKPMHKSWGNSVEFNEGANKIGVDVMRWMYARANPAENMLFGYKLADEVRRRFHLKLWNIYNFFVTYANLDCWEPTGDSVQRIADSKNILDQWILVRLNQTIKTVTDGLDKFDAFSASEEIDKFVDDLSLWYIRRSRDRVGPAAESESDKEAFYQTTYFVLCTISKLLAPFTPFLSEIIYKNLTKEESVHLSDWPEINEELITNNLKLLEEMQKIREVVETAHAIRKEKAISVKQALSSYSTTQKPVSENLEYLLKDEINVKKIIWNSKKDEFDTTITSELEEEAKARDLMRKIQEERKNMGLNLTQKVNVENGWVPKDAKLKEWILKKAQVEKISEGEFNVKKI